MPRLDLDPATPECVGRVVSILVGRCAPAPWQRDLSTSKGYTCKDKPPVLGRRRRRHCIARSPIADASRASRTARGDVGTRQRQQPAPRHARHTRGCEGGLVSPSMRSRDEAHHEPRQRRAARPAHEGAQCRPAQPSSQFERSPPCKPPVPPSHALAAEEEFWSTRTSAFRNTCVSGGWGSSRI